VIALVVLAGMIAFDFGLHFTELVTGRPPRVLPVRTRIGYTRFWTLYWLAGLFLAVAAIVQLT
jgi:hypothetical protein